MSSEERGDENCMAMTKDHNQPSMIKKTKDEELQRSIKQQQFLER